MDTVDPETRVKLTDRLARIETNLLNINTRLDDIHISATTNFNDLYEKFKSLDDRNDRDHEIIRNELVSMKLEEAKKEGSTLVYKHFGKIIAFLLGALGGFLSNVIANIIGNRYGQ